MSTQAMHRIAAIDLGTVSSRLCLATICGGTIISSQKHTEITDLGEGVDATGQFSEAAVGRVIGACRTFVEEARAFGAVRVCTTLTSAARDVSNPHVLLDPLCDLGLIPQIIPGELEARLTFFGVAHDFPDQRIVVADSGGGSTELALGTWHTAEHTVELNHIRSLNIGCRRITERFLHHDPALPEEEQAASAWAADMFVPYWESCSVAPKHLVAVGGTVTTLVAMVHQLTQYDPQFVHLNKLSLTEIDAALRMMAGRSSDEIACMPGIQPKRAPVIRGGALIMRELMHTGQYKDLTVSENSLLAGMASTIGEVLAGENTSIGWVPELTVW